MNNNKNNPILGFTLIELLIVISIIGITLAIAAPSFQSLIASNRLTASANDLSSALQLAKSEAIKRNRLVIVSKNGSWANGWVVFTDIDQDGSQDTDGTEPTISSFDALSTGFTVDPDSDSVTYRPDGRSTTFGSFFFCSPANTADFRRVVIASTGRVRVETPATSGIDYATNCPGNG
ncbi:MAG: GspH/FimT family pseudopilin [Methylobacter sp.]